MAIFTTFLLTFNTSALTQKPLLGKLRLTSIIELKTGLHIGGGGETLDIGGLDKPVIRDPLTKYPYLPGSSLKGKMRAILERMLNKPLNRAGGSGTYRYESDDLADGFTEVKQQNSPLLIWYKGARDCELSRLFGSTGVECWIKSSEVKQEQLEKVSGIEPRLIIASANLLDRKSGRFDNEGAVIGAGEVREEYTKVKGRNSPARLIVRDCYLLPESAAELKRADTGLYMTEWKFENGIDRVTSAANPRQIERVPAGSKFQLELIYTVENQAQAIADLENIAIALAILEDDALGGHGSRGYGQIKFTDFQVFYRSLEKYRQIIRQPSGSSGSQPISSADDTAALLDNFSGLRDKVERLLPDKGDEA